MSVYICVHDRPALLQQHDCEVYGSESALVRSPPSSALQQGCLFERFFRLATTSLSRCTGLVCDEATECANKRGEEFKC